MGLFSPSHKNISPERWHHLSSDLRMHGFTPKEVGHIKDLAVTQWQRKEPLENHPGLDKGEIDILTKTMAAHPDLAHIPSDKIEAFRELANKHLSSGR